MHLEVQNADVHRNLERSPATVAGEIVPHTDTNVRVEVASLILVIATSFASREESDATRVFGFQAQFDAGGFGDAAEKQVLPRTVGYFFDSDVANGNIGNLKGASSSACSVAQGSAPLAPTGRGR